MEVSTLTTYTSDLHEQTQLNELKTSRTLAWAVNFISHDILLCRDPSNSCVQKHSQTETKTYMQEAIQARSA